MIRDRLRRACVGLLLLGVLAMVAGAWRPFDRASAGSAADAPSATAALAALPQRFEIDISDLVINLRGKPQKEIEDQLRDWAVYGTLIELGVDKDELGKATFKTAPVRLPYLEQAFTFDYGRGRRALLGDRQAVLFHDADDPDPTATLGRLADKVRMETGEMPERFHVLAITPDLATSTIQIVREPDVEGTAMFGSQYGYVERSAVNLGELQAWLAEIDDVTYAGVRGSVLYLGGRRAAKSRTKNVTVDDIAALLQAQNVIARDRERIEARVTDINAEFQAEMKQASAWRARTLEQELRPVYEKKIAEIKAGPSAPGFSLDPQWNPAGLAETLEKAAENPCAFYKETFQALKAGQGAELDSAPFILYSSANLYETYSSLASTGQKNPRAVCAAARAELGPQLRAMARDVRVARLESDLGQRVRGLQRAMLPLWTSTRDLRARPHSEASSLSLALFTYIQARHQIQCARYDGPLAGTHVGMNLFYTDLLAKLWEGVDLHHASPGASVPGFLSSPRMRLEDEWKAESERLPSTRIWFGPKPDGYTRSKEGDSVWFEHIATRVFAAGSDPANPDKEERPSEGSRRSLSWWDHHYEAVADYEQEYHVQNQIEKWSLITGWWRDKLQYLSLVAVDHGQRFDRWYDREKPNLRYQFAIPLRPESEWVTQTECIDLLASYPFVGFASGTMSQIEGGVSLGGRRAMEQAPKISAEKPWALRQAAPDAAEGRGSSAGVRPLYRGPGEVTVELASTTPTRAGAVDVGLHHIGIKYARADAAEATIALRSDKGAIGSIVGNRRASGVGLHWIPDEVHTRLVEARPSPSPSHAPRLPVHIALEALKEGEDGKALDYLTETSKGNPARLRAGIDDLSAGMLEDADARLAAGNPQAASRGYQMAGEMLGKLPPSVRMRQALADIQSGQANRGRLRLAELEGGESEALLNMSKGKPGLEELHGLAEAKRDHAPSLFGKTANEVSVVAEGPDLRTVLRIDPESNRSSLPVEKRVEMLREHGDDVVVYVSGFSFNGSDFEAAGPGTLTELARSPNVTWRAVENAGGMYKPGVLVEDQTRSYQMPMLGKKGLVDQARALLNAPRVVIIHNCDANNDGSLSDQEKAACHFR